MESYLVGREKRQQAVKTNMHEALGNTDEMHYLVAYKKKNKNEIPDS